MYTLRHSHASALHYCGWTVPDAAGRMGHSAVVHMGIYAHPIKVIGSRRYRDLDDLIAEARGTLVCPKPRRFALIPRKSRGSRVT